MLIALFLHVLLACGAEPVKGVHHHNASESSVFLKAHPDAMVVDVRTPGEFKSGHLKGAKNLDYSSSDFAASVAKLPKDKPVLIHCQAGGRSTAALAVFLEAGFTDVHHMDGGLGKWKAAGLPVDGPSSK